MIYAIDSSGSTAGDLMMEMCRFFHRQADAIQIIFFDTRVIRVIRAEDFSPPNIMGGGTLVQPVFDWMRDNAPEEELVVVSDGFFYEQVQTHGVKATLVLNSEGISSPLNAETKRAFREVRHIQ